MGYYSRLAMEQMDRDCVDREWGRPKLGVSPRRELLEYQLEVLKTKLKHLDAVRPRDPLHPDYDRCFYSDIRRHYYEDPETVQDILRGIGELEERLWLLEHGEREDAAERRRLAEIKDLSKNLDEQILMVAYWDYAAMFREADTYRRILSVLKQ